MCAAHARKRMACKVQTGKSRPFTVAGKKRSGVGNARTPAKEVAAKTDEVEVARDAIRITSEAVERDKGARPRADHRLTPQSCDRHVGRFTAKGVKIESPCRAGERARPLGCQSVFDERRRTRCAQLVCAEGKEQAFVRRAQCGRDAPLDRPGFTCGDELAGKAVKERLRDRCAKWPDTPSWDHRLREQLIGGGHLEKRRVVVVDGQGESQLVEGHGDVCGGGEDAGQRPVRELTDPSERGHVVGAKCDLHGASRQSPREAPSGVDRLAQGVRATRHDRDLVHLATIGDRRRGRAYTKCRLVYTAAMARRLIAYLRVGPKEVSAERPELDAQLAVIRTACAQNDWELAGVEQEVRSGRLRRRQGLRGAIAACRAGQADGIIVARLDRLTYDLEHLAELVSVAGRDGFSIVSLEPAVDLDSEQGAVVGAVLSAAAGWSSRSIVRRAEAIARTKAEDAIVSRRPGRPTSTPMDLAERIREMRDRGLTLQAICDTLNREGVPTPRGGALWRPTSLRAILAASPTKP